MWSVGNRTADAPNRSSSHGGWEPAFGIPQQQRPAPRGANRRRPRRIVGGILERSIPGVTHDETKLAAERDAPPLWKASEAILKSYIQHHFLPRNDGEYRGEVDPDDALVYLAILVETKLLDPHVDLATVELQPFVHPFCRNSNDNNITVFQRKITRIRLGYSSCGSWDFDKPHVWDLLDKLDNLQELHLEGCSDLCVLETTSRLNNLRSLTVECQTRHGIRAFPPRRLKDDDESSRFQLSNSTTNATNAKPPPPHPLETLCITSCVIESQDDLDQWLLDVVLPCFPNLRVLRFGSNQLDGFQNVALRLQQDDSLQNRGRTHALHTLDLGRWVPKHERAPSPKRARRTKATRRFSLKTTSKERKQPRKRRINLPLPNEMAAMQVLFSTFRQLRVVRGTPDALTELYCVSRALVVETHSKPLPLSLWPVALATAWKRGFGFVPKWESYRAFLDKPSPDGIYHLLKHVLAEKEKKLFAAEPLSAAPDGDATIGGGASKTNNEVTDCYQLLAVLDRGFDD